MSNVSHPKHYNQGKIEVIEFIEDKNLDFCLANTIKYICRAGIKNPATHIEDLEKAAWYLARKIERLKAEKEGRAVVRPNDMFKVDTCPNCGSQDKIAVARDMVGTRHCQTCGYSWEPACEPKQLELFENGSGE